MSPTFWTSFPPPTPSYPSRLSEHQIRAPCIIQQISTGCLNFTHGNGYISVLLSPFVPSSPSCSVSTSLVSVCISTAALQKSSYYSLSQELSRCLITIISNHHRKESKYYWSPYYRKKKTKNFDASIQDRRTNPGLFGNKTHSLSSVLGNLSTGKKGKTAFLILRCKGQKCRTNRAWRWRWGLTLYLGSLYRFPHACGHAQSCPPRCDPMDCGPPGSSVQAILQARILVWIAMPFSRRSSQPRDRTRVPCRSCTGRWILYQ